MRNKSKVQRAAMGALVAMALVAGAGQASAAASRFPEGGPGRLPWGRVRIMDDGSGAGALGRLKLMLSSVRIFRDGGWEGIEGQRVPAKIARRGE